MGEIRSQTDWGFGIMKETMTEERGKNVALLM